MRGNGGKIAKKIHWESLHDDEGYVKKIRHVTGSILHIWVEADRDIALSRMDTAMLDRAVRECGLGKEAVTLLWDLSHVGEVNLSYKQSIADIIFNWSPGLRCVVFFNVKEPVRVVVESFIAIVPEGIDAIMATTYEDAEAKAEAVLGGTQEEKNGRTAAECSQIRAKNEFLAAVARISWMNMLDQHIAIPSPDNRFHLFFKAVEAMQSDLRAKESEKEMELDKLKQELEQRLTHMVIKMNAQTELNKKSGRDFEKEIAELKARIATQDMELTRVSTAIAEKTTALRNLLDQIYALDIDPTQKRQMTDSCLSLIETETIEKRLNIELTEADSVFLSKLQKKHPNLNQRELRISLLVKLNYDTREIARSVGISTRGMESIRYRMHKKLGLGKHQSIKTYLSDLAVTM
ncbi:transcriptional regulator [Chlorobium sp. N1]|uniref:transcriptional regulator n=1 Tax=Chlorobium sp. N1 TaxID=2491138 RepID=UPI001038F13C|nr:transcriptional regulator [Chlorobium sp. N1]TCD47925.1 transcriptional regulator [Chlorobium sp. N1]